MGLVDPGPVSTPDTPVRRAPRKAQATLDEAQGQADALRAEARQWLGQTLEEYDGLRAAMDDLFRKASAVSQWEETVRQADELARALRERTEGEA